MQNRRPLKPRWSGWRRSSGNVPLEESLKLFQEGTALVQSCTKLLDGAETEIVKLMKTADGTPAETEYVRDE